MLLWDAVSTYDVCVLSSVLIRPFDNMDIFFIKILFCRFRLYLSRTLLLNMCKALSLIPSTTEKENIVLFCNTV